jgi:hypothetical protein
VTLLVVRAHVSEKPPLVGEVVQRARAAFSGSVKTPKVGWLHNLRNFRREPVSAEFFFEFDPVGFGKPLEDGMDVAHLRFQIAGPQPQVKMESSLPVEIACGEDGLRMKALPTIRGRSNA